MNKRFRGTLDFERARSAVLTCALGLVLVALWPGAAAAQSGYRYDLAVIESAIDDGGGRIRISWSFKTAQTLSRTDPGPAVRVCANYWASKYFYFNWDACTSELSGSPDLVFDSGIGELGEPSATFGVRLAVYYKGIPLLPVYGGEKENPEVELTVKAP